LHLTTLTDTHPHLHQHPPSLGLHRARVRPVAETSLWQLATLTRDWHPWPRRDSNPQSQEASDCSPRLRSRNLSFSYNIFVMGEGWIVFSGWVLLKRWTLYAREVCTPIALWRRPAASPW